MPHSRIKLGVTCLAALAWSASALAEDKKDWFESEPDESKGEKAADPEAGETAAPQEEGGVPVAESASGGWLTEGSIALNAGLHLGLGGNTRVDRSGLDSDNPMAATIGMQAGGEYVVHKYFAAGGELRLAGVNTRDAQDRDIGRDLVIDILVRPRGRYVFESIGLEAYGALPVGVSFLNINDDKAGDANAGFAIGLDLGAIYFFTEKWGASSSVGWMWHRFAVDGLDGTGSPVTYHATISQFQWFFSAVYAL